MGLFTLPGGLSPLPSTFTTSCLQSTAEMPQVALTEPAQVREAAQILHCTASQAFIHSFIHSSVAHAAQYHSYIASSAIVP